MGWFINAYYGVQLDTKINYGGMIYLGKLAMQSKPRKKNLGSQSSTEAEIVGIDEHISGIMWIMRCLEAQGYKVKYRLIYQDNQRSNIMKKMRNTLVVRR